MKKNKSLYFNYHNFIIYGVIVALITPVLITILHSFSTSWGATILPDGLSFEWYIKLWTDVRFLSSLTRSIILCFSALFISVIILTPAIFVIFYYFPNLKKYINIIVALPFAIPPVVCSVGLLHIYSGKYLQLVGTPYILIGAYFTIALPLILQTLANQLHDMNITELIDTAHLLGANIFKAFILIFIPSIRKSLISCFMLSFSFLLGEFVFANLLVGTNFETMQIYLYSMKGFNSHFTSAIVVSYFLIILFLTWLANKIAN